MLLPKLGSGWDGGEACAALVQHVSAEHTLAVATRAQPPGQAKACAADPRKGRTGAAPASSTAPSRTEGRARDRLRRLCRRVGWGRDKPAGGGARAGPGARVALGGAGKWRPFLGHRPVPRPRPRPSAPRPHHSDGRSRPLLPCVAELALTSSAEQGRAAAAAAFAAPG